MKQIIKVIYKSNFYLFCVISLLQFLAFIFLSQLKITFIKINESSLDHWLQWQCHITAKYLWRWTVYFMAEGPGPTEAKIQV